MKVQIVLPVHNEAKALPLLLRRIEESLAQGAIRCQIIFVDDGSTDGSLCIARSFARAVPVSILHHEEREGLGRTIRDGLRRALEGCFHEDAVVTIDADNSQPPERIPEMLKRVEAGFDVVIASRYAPGASAVHVPLYRRLLSRLGNMAYSAFVPVKGVRDYTCGFRAYKARILREGFRTYGDAMIRSRGFECMAELLVKLRRLGARFVEVPFTLDYGAKPGLSKMRLPQTILGNLRVLTMPHRQPRSRFRAFCFPGHTRLE